MANEKQGDLGKVNIPTGGALTSVYKVPVAKKATGVLSIANRSNTATSITVAQITNGNVGDVATSDYKTFELPTTALQENRAPLAYTLIVNAGDTVAVSSSSSDVTAIFNGVENDL